MVKVPGEITAIIISHLSEQQTDGRDDQGSEDSLSSSLTQYAAVSRSWQERIEAKTFAHITLTPARVVSPIAAQALTPSRVHRFVRSVKVDVLLPAYSDDARTRRENGEEKLANNKVFTDVIRKVFALLSSPFPAAEQPMGNLGGDNAGNAQQPHEQLEQGVSPTGYRPKIKLSVTAFCASDMEDLEGRRYRQRVNAISTGDIFEARYESSYLDLSPAAGKTVRDEAEALPELLCVSEFDVQATQAPGHRLFVPRMLCLLASRMTGLRSLDLMLCDNEKRDLALRKRLRADEPNQRGDKLSVALRKLSQRLRSFTLIADVGREIFWPSETERLEDNDQPWWPSMKDYSIGLGPIAPSGEWRFQRPTDASDNEDDDDEGSMDSMQLYEASIAAPGDDREDPFRDELDKEAAAQLLLAAARAATCMPKLFSMSFTLSPAARDGGLCVFYTDGTRGGAGVVELCVESHPVYHPDEGVLRLWRQAARVNAGREFEVVIKDSQSW